MTTTTNTEQQLLLNTDEAAALLRLSPSALVSLRKTGGLPFVRLGKRVLYKREALLAFIDRNQTSI